MAKGSYAQLIHLDGKRMERVEKMGKAHLEPKEYSSSSGRRLACMDRNGRKGLGIAYKVDLVGRV